MLHQLNSGSSWYLLHAIVIYTPEVCTQYTNMTPEGIARGRMLIYCIQSEGLANNYFIAHCFHGYNSALSNKNNRMAVFAQKLL